MGLGKTLQAISFVSYLKFHQKLAGPFRESFNEIFMFIKTSSEVMFVNAVLNLAVVLCPLSVTDGWVSEISRFTPKLEVLRYVGDKDCRRSLRKSMYDHVKKSSYQVSFELSH